MHGGNFNDIQGGFTLIELLVVLLILSVLAFFAYPSYHALMQRVESHSVRRHIHEAIRLAKIESYAQRKDVIICAMNAQNVCSKVAQERFVVFVDRNRNNQFDKADAMISNQELILKYGMIDMGASAGRHYMKFMGDTAKPRGNFGHIKYCNTTKDMAHSFRVVVNMHGRVSEKHGNLVDVGCDTV